MNATRCSARVERLRVSDIVRRSIGLPTLAGWPTQVSLTAQAIDVYSEEQDAEGPRRSAPVGSANRQSLRISLLATCVSRGRRRAAA